jgi:hypothetical protein
MTAPMIQRSGKKIPKKNIQPCPFLNVMNPRVNSKTTYRKTPVPIPHHIELLSRFVVLPNPSCVVPGL